MPKYFLGTDPNTEAIPTHNNSEHPKKTEEIHEILENTQGALTELKHNILRTNSQFQGSIEQTPNTAITTLLNTISTNPSLNDPQYNNIETIKQKLQSGNVIEAVSSIFHYIKQLLQPHHAINTFWFKNTTEIHNFISTIRDQRDKLSIQDLENYKEAIHLKINSISGTKRKLALTHALSAVLDGLIWKTDPSKSWMKGNIESGKKSPNELAIARMSQSIQAGDILAINKSEQHLSDKLLTKLSETDLDTSHVLIVTDINRKTGEITVAHSTSSKLNSTGKGVETDVSLKEYCKQFNAISIAALEPPTQQRQQLVANVLAKNGKGYGHFSAASSTLLDKNIAHSNDKYNCVELIAQSFPNDTIEDMKNRTHPSQYLEHLIPKYITIAGKSIGGS